MREVILLAIPDCPLTAHARDLLATLATEQRLAWHETAAGTAAGHDHEHDAPRPAARVV